MKAPENFTRIVNGKRYSTATATLIAHDAYWDDRNFERDGRNTFLYRTPRGAYFLVKLTRWQGERDTLTPVTEGEARELWETLGEQAAEYEAAFPGVTVQDA